MSILRVSFEANRRPAVDRLAQRIHHAANDRITDRHFQQASGGLDGVAFLDVQIVAENDRADGVLFQIEHLPHRAVLEFQQLAGHGIAQAIDAGDAVTDFDDRADFIDLQALFKAGDFLLQDAGDFRDVDCHVGALQNPANSPGHF